MTTGGETKLIHCRKYTPSQELSHSFCSTSDWYIQGLELKVAGPEIYRELHLFGLWVELRVMEVVEMYLFGGVYDPFRQGFDCKRPSGSLKVIYGAGEKAQLLEARLTTKSKFMCLLWNLALNLASLKFNKRRRSEELGF